MSTLILLLLLAGDPADGCFAFSASGDAHLGQPVSIPGSSEPVVGGGALPFNVNLGPYSGMLSSVVTAMEVEDGIQHLQLQHYFVSDAGEFWTTDTATCTPVEDGPATACEVRTEMEIVRGTGVFENASGTLHNEGLITMTDPTYQSSPFGELQFNLSGELCGVAADATY